MPVEEFDLYEPGTNWIKDVSPEDVGTIIYDNSMKNIVSLWFNGDKVREYDDDPLTKIRNINSSSH